MCNMDPRSVGRLSASVIQGASEPVAGTGRETLSLVEHSFWNELCNVWLGMVLRTVISTG
jgi:hypothetical protein